MRVLILTEGGKGIGLGHLTRCLAIFQVIKETESQAQIQFVINKDKVAQNFLKGQKVNVLSFNWYKETNKILSLARDSDWVVIDSYLAKKYIYRQISAETGGRLLMVDDYKRLEYPRGTLVNPSIYGDRLSYPKKKGLTYLLGKDYIILRKEFWNTPKKNIKKSVKNILISLGGMNYYKLASQIARFLKNKFGFDLFITGQKKHKSSAKEMLDLMLKADICISGGGQTTNELAAVGVPTIGICFAGNQRLNLKGWQNNGFIEYLGWYGHKNLLEKIESAINKLIPYEERVKRNKIGIELVDGEGVERILANFKVIIDDKTQTREVTLRPAAREDCRVLWIWRNHPLVRKWCFDSNKIEYKNHKAWFEKKLKDQRVKIYIAENRKGAKIGQVRLEKIGKTVAYINVNLNPRFFGRGYGQKIIKMATEVFMNENPKVNELRAEIISENIISKKAFKKAGYLFSHNTFKNGKQAIIFKFK